MALTPPHEYPESTAGQGTDVTRLTPAAPLGPKIVTDQQHPACVNYKGLTMGVLGGGREVMVLYMAGMPG